MSRPLDPTSGVPPDYDGLARPYRMLEYLALGRCLEAARFNYLDRLSECRHLLVIGEGDGRCLARVLRLWPRLEATCVDASPAMLSRAARRLGETERARVAFVRADAREYQPPAGVYDGVITHFFLDGLTGAETAALTARVSRALRRPAVWLVAEFALPGRGVARWRARIWLAGLYAFFRWRTGLRVSSIPEYDRALAAAGFERAADRQYQAGLIRSSVFVRPDADETA